ncbi:MAG: tRNA threonylcarbamoyladenosine dehydratase [Muribaculaceae bacterium]|mgnify:FL=1
MDAPCWLERTAIVAGPEMMDALARTSVAVFGVGGVGSWCVEALARTGVGAITIADPDCVAQSNINRQLPALVTTVGQAKVDVLARRIADINANCAVKALQKRYTPETAADFGLNNYDYVVDAIDSLPDKASLILRCTSAATAPRAGFVSSMGAARKLDPARVSVAEFWKVEGCALARALRTRFRRSGEFPGRKFRCVYSPESIPQCGDAGANGTFMHITATFGLRLASLIIEDIYRRTHANK